MNGADGGAKCCGIKEQNGCTLDGVCRLKSGEGGAQ